MFLCASVYSIQNFHNRVYAADDGVVLVDKGCKLGFQNFLNLLDNIGAGTVHNGYTLGNIRLSVRRQSRNNEGCLG